ncbi:MAG: hypothetical protein GYA23_01885 [Methanomicrobiales archaeon]|nr:hypothetical protein [Methanomicrobiales archaeon]
MALQYNPLFIPHTRRGAEALIESCAGNLALLTDAQVLAISKFIQLRGPRYEDIDTRTPAEDRRIDAQDPGRPEAPRGIMAEVTLTRTEWPDSIELGKTSAGGVLKIYFNASNLSEAQQRIENADAARQHLLNKLAAGGGNP